MLQAIKKLFIKDKDYAGRDVDQVIWRLAHKTNTPVEVWSYLEAEHLYENTQNRMKIYPHEIVNWD